MTSKQPGQPRVHCGLIWIKPENEKICLNCIINFLNGLKLYFLRVLNQVLTICVQKVFRSRKSLTLHSQNLTYVAMTMLRLLLHICLFITLHVNERTSSVVQVKCIYLGLRENNIFWRYSFFFFTSKAVNFWCQCRYKK